MLDFRWTLLLMLPEIDNWWLINFNAMISLTLFNAYQVELSSNASQKKVDIMINCATGFNILAVVLSCYLTAFCWLKR